MRFSFSTLVYKLLIDPILSKLHDTILSNIEPTDRVIDVACGTGSQAISIAGKAENVIGIDLSEEMISEAQRASRLRGLKNVQFRIRDASDLSTFRDREFNIAVTSMAIHQFDADLAVKILCEMRRIALKTIIVDYNYPIPKGFSRSVVFAIERLAGGDHYRNFRLYMGNLGLRYFTNAAGLSILSSVVKGNGVFLIEVGT
jgi:tRNA/tmRNA/rRNA uracil-C5-methylase (TrmA/RlmC/RlmD family)